MTAQQVLPEFRMSAFAALSGLRRYLRDHPNTDVYQAAASLRRSDADYSGVDFDSGIRLHARLPEEIDFSVPDESIRSALSVLIEMHLPWWCRLFPYGRQRLADALSQDELQTFKSAGLFQEHPTEAVIEWWDALAAKMRGLADERLNAQGRCAEQLTLCYEAKRLADLGISRAPRWIALDDNSAGYDIQSYDPTDYGIRNRLIEVKSSTRNPPRIFLSRGEWEAAIEYGDSYFFYLWMLPHNELQIFSVHDISVHIPSDVGTGRWGTIEIQF